MTQPDPHDELARRLFEAARREQPSAEARRRAQLGVTREAGGAFALEVEGVERGQRQPGRATAVSGIAAALLAALALCAAVAWVAIDARGPSARDEAFAITPEQKTDPQPQPPANEAASIDEEPPVLGPAPEPPLSGRPRPAAAGSASPQPRALPAATLAEEIAHLDRARAALAAHDGRRALALVDEYERVLRGTRLRAEAALLRIEALAASGERRRAAERARRFVREHPGSPLVDRARALGQIKNEIEMPPVEGGR